MEVAVRYAGELSEAFPVAAGVKQGCVLAPTLFNIFPGGSNEHNYDDDAALVCHSADGPQRSLDFISLVYGRAGLNINTDKTEVVQQLADNDQIQATVFVYSVELKNSSTFMYLGSELVTNSEFRSRTGALPLEVLIIQRQLCWLKQLPVGTADMPPLKTGPMSVSSAAEDADLRPVSAITNDLTPEAFSSDSDIVGM
ncbi:hypothetical protein O3P69_014404 [Scylla paramamosain]|uniref:Reverse transcriptase domain-containing protein n=1 Tax=Scylla paramamosain TaxID=85552 RepID=A0AAW0TBT3_SCYPA